MSTALEEFPDVAPQPIDSAQLLRACARCMKAGTLLEEAPEAELRRWWDAEHARCGPLAGSFASSDADWGSAIAMHRAHRHPFYDELATSGYVHDYAQLLLESWVLPAFLPLVERVFEVQTQTEGIEALLAKIHQEQAAAGRTELMRQLTMAVAVHAQADSACLDLHDSLNDRALVFYYGYFCDPWQLAGALFASEVMAAHQAAMIGTGLARLGYPAEDLQLIQARSATAQTEPDSWLELFGPAMDMKPAVREAIAQGIAACLETCARYLDDLERRALPQPPAAAEAV